MVVGGTRARARRMLVRVVGAVVAASGLVAVSPAGPASAAEWWEGSSSATWYDGQPSYSQVLNCFSVIQGSPYYEYGVGAYIGYLADPEELRPSTGDKSWIRYRVYGMGNPCSGGSYFRPKFYLPSGWSWDTTRQIACAYDGSGGSAPQANCPGWGNMDGSGAYWNNGSGSGGNLWGVAQGHYWEFQFPVTVSPTAQSGVVLDAHLDVADGNSNPQMLLRTNNVFVFNGSNPAANAVSVMYDQPSSFDASVQPGSSTPTAHGMLSQFQAVVGRRGGTVRLELATDAGFTNVVGWDQGTFPANTFDSINVWTDWGQPSWPGAPTPNLTPGTTYYWRGIVYPSGGGTVAGVTQSFQLKSGGGVVASSIGGAASSGGVGTGSGGVTGGTLTPIPVPAAPQPTTPTVPSAPPVAPTATASLPKSAKATKGIQVTVTCSGPCTAKAAATVSKKVAKKLGVKSRSIGTAAATIAPSGAKTFAIKLSRKIRARIAKIGRISASVRVTTTVGGTSSSTTRTVIVKG